MKKVAKLLIIDPDDAYLLMYRNDHPMFGTDPDLPGGTQEEGETLLQAMLREVEEEAGITIDANKVRELYSGTEYSNHGTWYALFAVHVEARPKVTTSWEHSCYGWVPRDEFLEKIKDADDTYMHMVFEVVSKRK